MGSRHPIAHALLTMTRQMHLPTTSDLVHIPGGGLQATIDGLNYRLGHHGFAVQSGLDDECYCQI
ncbi:MAG: hypothetical protein U1E91_01090 [Moraxella sp.]